MAAPPSWYSRYVAVAPSAPVLLRSAYRSGIALLHAGWSRYESPITITLLGGTCPLTHVAASGAAAVASSEALPPSPVFASSPGTFASSPAPDDDVLPPELEPPELELPEPDPESVPDPEPPELLPPLDEPVPGPASGVLAELPHPPNEPSAANAPRAPVIPSALARDEPKSFMKCPLVIPPGLSAPAPAHF